MQPVSEIIISKFQVGQPKLILPLLEKYWPSTKILLPIENKELADNFMVEGKNPLKYG